MSERLDSLIQDNYDILPFRDLPRTYQLAIIWYNAIDGSAWEDAVDISSVLNQEGVSDDDIKLELMDRLPEYIETYGSRLFGMISINAYDIQQSVMCDPEIGSAHDNWDVYHARYIDAGDMPNHSHGDRWPVILSNDIEETILDGWHRFHCYCRDGAEQIPAIFYPDGHHLVNRGLISQENSDLLAVAIEKQQAELSL